MDRYIQELRAMGRKKLIKCAVNAKELEKKNKDLLTNYPYNKLFKNPCKKCDNDLYNSKREAVIMGIGNKTLINYSPELEKQIELFTEKLRNKYNIPKTASLEWRNKGGRGNKFDFLIIFTWGDMKKEVKVEFKHNTITIENAPQFFSPGKPSQYMDNCFEDYFFDNGLKKIAKKFNLELPDKNLYIKTNTTNKVECLKEYKELYDRNSEFRNFCKNIDHIFIEKFIKITNLNINKLSKKILEDQMDKNYMCYKDGIIYHREQDPNLFIIEEVIGKTRNSFICKTRGGMTLNVMLRFKNGLGLQFPGFQISRKIPTVNELKIICRENNISPVPKLKNDIIVVLNENRVIF